MAGPISQTLPYFCDPKNLPGPLPSPDEIEAATEALPGTYEPKYKRVVAITQAFVVKHGVPPWVSENEGHALLLLSQHPSIPVPRLYAMYREGNRLFLIMERKDGIQLGQVWGELTQDDKRDIMGQLKAILSQIRTIPSPGLFGNAVGGPLRHRFFLSANGYRPWTSEFLERNLPAALAGHASVFTHADLQCKNILVTRNRATTAQGEGDTGSSSSSSSSSWRVSAVVDWEDAGWYPSYWEYARSFVDFIWEDDWPEMFELMVEPCPLEAGLLRFVRQDLDY